MARFSAVSSDQIKLLHVTHKPFPTCNYRIAATTPATARRTPAVLRALSAALLVFSALAADSVAELVASGASEPVAVASDASAVAVEELVLVALVAVP